MLRQIAALLRIFFYWLLLINFCRLFFIAMNWKLAADLPLTEVFLSFWYAIRLDVSMAGYICVLPVCLYTVSQLFGEIRITSGIHRLYTILFTTLIVLISVIDAVLYRYWGQKLNAYALSFAKFPKDMLMFSSGASSWLLACLLVLLLILSIVIYKKMFKDFKVFGHVVWWKSVVLFVLVLPVVFLGIRGGISKAVINQSAAFYSSKPFLNHVAVNTSWNFLATLIEPLEDQLRNPYAFIDEQEAEQLVSDFGKTDSVAHFYFVNRQSPNVLFIVLEGWTADVVEAIGGEQHVTDNFSRWSKEGYLFDRFYANGNRTDKGIASIFSAQPALAHSSIINNIGKFISLPSVAREFANKGYHTVFHYGGDAMFANMKGYWLSAGFEKIRDLYSFSLKQQNADWGVHDDEFFSKVLNELNGSSHPFFASMLTLSSHEPFKVPYIGHFKGNTDADRYRNSVQFSDKCLGEFLDNARQQPWYQNTLIIILADHGHQCPKDRSSFDPERFRIPFLITGGALKDEYRGKVNHRIANQVDIAATLLQQVGIHSSTFIWSRNLTDTTANEFATYVFNDGIGLITPESKLVFDQETKSLIVSEGNDSNRDEKTKFMRAYEQVYYQEYLKR